MNPTHVSPCPDKQRVTANATQPSPRRRLIGGLLAGGALALGVRVSPVRAQAASAAAGASEAMRLLLTKATRLSILTDRIVRSQVQRSLGVLVPRAVRIHADSLVEARLILGILRSANLSASLRPLLDGVTQQVGAFLGASEDLKIEDRAALTRLAVQADEAGASVDKLVDAYLRDTGQSNAAILQTTAELQRLTQHLAVHYLLARAGVEATEQMKEVNTGRQDFERALSELKKSPLRSARIEAAMPLLDGQWTLFRMALANASADTSAQQTVSTTSERTLEVLTDLYGLYEVALRQGG